jgi:hypothetical protein
MPLPRHREIIIQKARLFFFFFLFFLYSGTYDVCANVSAVVGAGSCASQQPGDYLEDCCILPADVYCQVLNVGKEFQIHHATI